MSSSRLSRNSKRPTRSACESGGGMRCSRPAWLLHDADRPVTMLATPPGSPVAARHSRFSSTMMRIDRQTLIVLALLAACAFPGASSALAQVDRPAAMSPRPAPAVSRAPPRVAIDTTRFESEVLSFEAGDRVVRPAAGGILFVGSSSIRLWPDLGTDFPGRTIVNRGFGGSTLAEVAHYVPRLIVPHRPRLIVVYAGDNDLASGMTPVEVAADYRRIVSLVRRELPGARFAFVSIKPSPSRWHLIDAYREANRLIAADVAADPGQSYVDVFTPMLGPNGRPHPSFFTADSLHMTRRGYDLWRGRLDPIVR